MQQWGGWNADILKDKWVGIQKKGIQDTFLKRQSVEPFFYIPTEKSNGCPRSRMSTLCMFGCYLLQKELFKDKQERKPERAEEKLVVGSIK